MAVPSIFTMYNLNFITRVGLALGLVINFAVVLAFKFLVARWTIRLGALPISILILVDELEKLMATGLLSLMMMFDIVEGKSIIIHMGWSECFVRLVCCFCFLAIFYGGMAVSLMRLIYIKGNIQ